MLRRWTTFAAIWLTTAVGTSTLGQTTISSEKLAVKLSPTGIDSISLNGKQITSAGGMSFYDDQWVPQTPGTLASPKSPTSAKAEGEADHATIDQTFDNLHVLWTYRVSGYDLSADIAVTNTGNQPFDRFFFRLPQFHFSRRPSGTMSCAYGSYYTKDWTAIAHPSTRVPLAVSDAYDDSFAIAIHCKSHFDRSVLVNSNWDHNVIPIDCAPVVYVDQTVAPQSTVHVLLNIRITDKLDLADRVGAYVDDFKKWAGPMRYEPDDRPVVCCYPESTSWITKTNPLGLSRRFDYLGGVLDYERLISPMVPYCQGPMMWQPQGAAIRGVEFRPDFDVWPPNIRQNLPILMSWCSNHGMRPGLQARPLDIVTPLNFTSDTSITLCPEEPSQVKMIETRFTNTIALGAKEFYLDSFGMDLPSYRLMQKLREKIGPNIPTYSEYTSDLMLPISGVYIQQMNAQGDTRWFGVEQVKVMRLLYPDSSFICTSELPDDPTTGAPALSWDDYAKLKYSPDITDNDAAKVAVGLKEMRAKYYDGNVWGKAAGSGMVATTQP